MPLFRPPSAAAPRPMDTVAATARRHVPLHMLEHTRVRNGHDTELVTLDCEDPEKEGRILVCRACHHAICREADRTERNGEHVHTLFNPYGVLFEVGIFRVAPGCAMDGQYVKDFTWFPGYRWRIALCSVCWAHLGWHFRAESGDGFWGLVLAHLDEAPAPGCGE